MSQSQRQAHAKGKKDLEVYMLPVACRVGQGGGVKLRAGMKIESGDSPVMHGWGREKCTFRSYGIINHSYQSNPT